MWQKWKCKLPVLILSLMLSASTLTACGGPSGGPALPAHFTTYTDQAKLFSISYPSDWELVALLMEDADQFAGEVLKSIVLDVPLEEEGLVFEAGAPVATGGRDPYMNIVVKPLPEAVSTLDEVVEIELEEPARIPVEHRELSRSRITVDGREAAVVDVEVSFPDGSESRCLALIMLVEETEWMVNCATSPEAFGEHEDDFHAIITSLRILK